MKKNSTCRRARKFYHPIDGAVVPAESRIYDVAGKDSARPSSDEIELLFVNNEKLDLIASHLNRFNPIRTMKMADMEIRHSAILSWLLDPNETHGLSDKFLKAFLAEAFRGRSALGPPTAVQISQSDLRDAEVQAEWKSIDVFILSRRNNWAFIIENKFHAKQHEGQLAKYVAKVRAVFEARDQKLNIHGIFLTLWDEDPHDASYAPLRYKSVCQILSRLLNQEPSITQEVRVFLRHYLEIIKDKTGMSDEQNQMEKLARELYRTHKKVLDFIWEHGIKTSFIPGIELAFGEGLERSDPARIGRDKYIVSGQNHYQYSFLPETWHSAFGGDDFYWPGCTGWWYGLPLICWLQLDVSADGTQGFLRLFAEVGPISVPKFRKDLIAKISAVADKHDLKDVRFQSGATDPGRKYSKFLKNNSIDINDVRDAVEINNAAKALLSRFKVCFDTIGTILPEFARYGADEDT